MARFSIFLTCLKKVDYIIEEVLPYALFEQILNYFAVVEPIPIVFLPS